MATPTVIPAGTRVDGLIECSRDLVIHGRCEGQVQAGGTVTVAADGVCKASVRAGSCQIHGEVIGNVICTDSIEVTGGGRVVGDLRAPDVSIHADAEIDGTVDLLPPDPRAIELARTQVRTRGPALVRPAPPTRSQMS